MSIKAISVSKIYQNPEIGSQSIEAVKDISLDVNEGSYTVIFGPTGSGKTTLLSLFLGITKPTGGEIVFNNIHLSQSNDNKISLFRERYIGYIPQNMLFIKDLTVLENILSPNSFLKRRMKQLKAYALYLLERLNLHEKAGFKPYELSGGENKKVMIARALLKKPLFLLADEPVSELDDESLKDVMYLFRDINKEGSAIIIASHTPIHFKKKVDFYKMKNGRITEYIRGENR